MNDRQPCQVLPGAPKYSPFALSLSKGFDKLSPNGERLTLVQSLRRPVLQACAERETTRGQHFLDLVERLAAQVRCLQQLGFGPLDQVADVVDVLGLQAVGRAHRQLELVDRAQQNRVELRAALRGRLVEDVADLAL